MRRIIQLAFMFVLISIVGGVGMRVPHVEAYQQQRAEPPPDPALEKMKKRAEKQRNEKRQGDLKRDTDALYKLASDLKKSVDSSNEHVLSLEVLRKTEEIQKLAKSVHDKMKAEGYSSTIPE
jgi:hypothetical protein